MKRQETEQAPGHAVVRFNPSAPLCPCARRPGRWRRCHTLPIVLLVWLVSVRAQAGIVVTSPEEWGLLYEHSRALVIGVSGYAETWSPLENTVQDAAQVADALSKQGFSVTLLTDGMPAAKCIGEGGCRLRTLNGLLSSDVLRSELREFLVNEGNEPSTRLLIWYAGHGATLGGEGFILGVDAPHASDARFPLHAVQMREIGSWVRLAKSNHVLIVFDSCFGATVFEPRQEVRPSLPVHQMLLSPVRQFITSGGPQEEVPDVSVFKGRFIEAILGKATAANPNGDRFLTASELGLYLSLAVHVETEGRQTPQYGELLDRRYDRGNFVFRWLGSDDSGAGRIITPPTEQRIEIPLPFRDCDQCPQLVTLKAGRFVMGDARRPQSVDNSFAIGTHEVTFDEWERCVAEGGCGYQPDDAGWGRGRHPVIRINLRDIEAYLSWLSRKTGYQYRLPTEVEWEYAARAGSGGEFWFGDEMSSGRANCRGCGVTHGEGTLPVGSFDVDQGGVCRPDRLGGENCFGLHDVHGNVWEWACTEIAEGARCREAVVRGGSWANGVHLVRAASRARVSDSTRSAGVGLRVVREVDPPPKMTDSGTPP